MSNIEEILKEWWRAPSRENDLSSKTYNLIKTDLETHFWNSVDVFLQGSYANSTNIQKDSDIDIVVCYKNTYYYNIDNLSEFQQKIFELLSTWSWKNFFEFKEEVLNFLKSKYSNNLVQRKNKCINISKWWDIKVNVDVVPCFEYRMYKSYWDFNKTEDYYSWTKFLSDNNEEIINFQKIYREKWESKNINTEWKYKEFVRIIKNLKKHLVDKSIIYEKLISSFLIENLVYNLDNSIFLENNSYIEKLNKILTKIKSDMMDETRHRDYEEVCWLFYLLRGWRIKERPEDIIEFIKKIYG